jgi:hypothetical protein
VRFLVHSSSGEILSVDGDRVRLDAGVLIVERFSADDQDATASYAIVAAYAPGVWEKLEPYE